MKLNKEKIEFEMKRLDWNYSRMAKEAGISRALLCYYMKSPPTLRIVNNVAKILNLDPKDLLI